MERTQDNEAERPEEVANAGTNEGSGAPPAVPEEPESAPKKTARARVSEYGEILQISLIYFSAVSLATVEFLKNAFPRRDIILPDKTGVIWAIVLLQVIPAIALIVTDRLLAMRDPSGTWNRWFRTAVFSVSLFLILRELEVYSDTGNDWANELRDVGEVAVWLAGAAMLAGIVALCVFALRGVTTFFYYVSPIAIVAVAVIPYQIDTTDSLPDGYAREVTTVDEGEERDPVFVLVFDEMDATQMVGEDGLINSERYPSMADLAADGAWFTNATSNYFWSTESIPSISLPVTRLNEDYNVRMYSQFIGVEAKYDQGCGESWTCRGVRYLTDKHKGFVAQNVGLKMFYNIIPERLEEKIEAPMGLVVNDMLGVSYPPRDDWGFQIFTKKQFDTFIADVNTEEAPGSAYFFHVLLPHHPHVFKPSGDASPDPLADQHYEAQGIQTEFVDKLVGEFVARLKEEGLYEESMVIVTSDHGYRGPFPGEDYELLHHTALVPLIIHGPGIEPQVSDVDYQHIDFEATLADVLQLPSPGGVGVSAFATDRPERDKIFHVNEMDFQYVPETGEWVRTGAAAPAGGGAEEPETSLRE